MGIAMCFFSGNCFESFRFWEILNANVGSGDPGNQYCIKIHGSSYYGKLFLQTFNQAENIFNLIFHAYNKLIYIFQIQCFKNPKKH